MNSPTTLPLNPTSTMANSHSTAVSSRPGERKRSRFKMIALSMLGVLVLGGAAYVSLDKSPTADKVRTALESLKEKVVGPTAQRASNAQDEPVKPPKPWNGLVKVTSKERDAIGFRIMAVSPQTAPIKLELPGRTDYDQNTLNKVRPRFEKTLVEKVHVSLGQSVKKGDPLYDLKSLELGSAKMDFRSKYVQWDHDFKLFNTREPLAKEGRITQVQWTDTQNDEKKSFIDYLNAREQLGIYEVPNDQIEKLLEAVSDDKKKALKVDDNTQDISRMTVLSRYDGVVVERDVVPGNVYDTNDVLLTISPMEKLWVYGDVFESDQDKVHLGQKVTITGKTFNEVYESNVESIANGIDPETRSLRIRTSIPNPGNTLVARALVQVRLQMKPLACDTVIPRNALTVSNGDYYAFVEQGSTGEGADLFERRKLEIEQEDHDIVIVRKGLNPGDRVVSNGSLILGQMYEDQSTVDSGMPRP